MTKKQEIDYFLFELNHQIHDDAIERYTKKAAELYQSQQKIYDQLAESGTPLTRLRAAAYAYPHDQEKYGKILNQAIAELQKHYQIVKN